MRRISISILVVVTLSVMAIEIFAGISKVWNEVEPSSIVLSKMLRIGDMGKDMRKTTQTLNVVPTSENTVTEMVHNTKYNVQTPYAVQQIVVGGWVPSWTTLLSLIFLPLLPLMIWGMVNFIKLLISVFRQQIFTKKNTRRLRVFAYTAYGSLAVIGLYEWLNYQLLAKQVELPGYEIVGYEFMVSWSDMFLVFLIVEIFALGVRLQEEQELTI